ncbi:hypothetical protein BDV27DRAFT_127974 [Aspergillus caelatus]|uniref:Uncharacterized protein n=1 Tax=Aspergillus caelatus TaxID=61420 RepID=A0A5N7A4K8_9EURO|nr:uncharacterized protein BDV27DRAFT_127974 [Aspergillus caelatus]KAE8364784.1 hypothetical protein BDV27DRAFT_127974 [Aspergillus caelatus]
MYISLSLMVAFVGSAETRPIERYIEVSKVYQAQYTTQMTLWDGTWHLNLLNCLSYMVNAHESWSHGGFSSFAADKLTRLGKD